MTEKYDEVTNPRHYTENYPIQPIEVIEQTEMSYNLGQIFKYLIRAPYKGNELQDLRKANYYINWLKAPEISKLLKSKKSKKIITSFFQAAINKSEQAPLFFKKSFEKGLMENSPITFIETIKELVTARIDQL
ncbi:DUF3310 domain-containing protein [Xylocopilactobacillus apicola]|uniref:DUF3310 domain-containing protein n=1 Tax=Xylocopilactobacillus apicola TaxID=2932184 RepID=A0AAU9DCV4_9LACO|nr:DUF3310 domain-containing protein [Xylocopilactobacillus apicola]BDR58637.1 hypothetical protein XA3_10780 [Xylocopilactobacillus apicola]